MSEEERPPLADLLRELDDKLEREGMPAGARNRIELRIRKEDEQGDARWRRWLPACTFAAGAALVLAVIGLRVPDDEAEGQDAATAVAVSGAPTLGAFTLAGEHCERHSLVAGAQMSGDCTLVSEQMTVQVWEEATVKTEAEGLRLAAGTALFDVEPVRPRNKPVRVAVSHGVIEVVGTRFAVAQGDHGGHVDLFEGQIRFRGLDGAVVAIEPGQRHAWGSEAKTIARAVVEPAPMPSDDIIEILPDTEKPPAAKRRSRADRAAQIIERVGELRADRRYREAVRVLRDANKRRWDRRTAQVLSYELGELLHRYVGDKRAACKHLQAHQRRFPSGRYHDAIVRTLDKLSCE